jgi:hypothetical protein
MSCNNITIKEQCEGETTSIIPGCVWVLNNLNNENTGSCLTLNEMSCNNITVEERCEGETSIISGCVWVLNNLNNENTGCCLTLNEMSCNNITIKEQCEGETSIIPGCVWVLDNLNKERCIASGDAQECSYYQKEKDCTFDESDNKCVWSVNKCYKQELSCENVKEESICLTPNIFVKNNVIIECVWVDVSGLDKKCMEKTQTCSNLINVLCVEFEHEMTENNIGLTVIDKPCFFNGESKEEMSCISKSLFSDKKCDDVKSKKICGEAETVFNWGYKCVWVGIVNDFYCIKENSAETCEYYLEQNICGMTKEGEMCLWNSTLGRCITKSVEIKSCDMLNTYKVCNSISDRCFWNGGNETTTIGGSCLPLEKAYSCSELTKTICNTYGEINGLTVVDSPCFFNGGDDEDGLFCTSEGKLINSSCEKVKTNNRVGIVSGPKYCDNAESLFGIVGDDKLGCVWDERGECVNVLKGQVTRPESCKEYETIDECNFNMDESGEECFWNSMVEGIDGACIPVKDIFNCTSICTNEISGLSSRFCDGNAINTGDSSEMCKWIDESGEIIMDCNCEGVLIEEMCSLLEIKTAYDCNGVVSMKGKCFFNGEIEKKLDVGDERLRCSDYEDIKKCEDLRNKTLCTYARRYVYKNLEMKSSGSPTTFMCLWDVERKICKAKETNIEESPGKEGNIVVIIIIVVGVCVVVATVIIIVIIVIKVKQKNNMRNSENKEFEIKDIYPDDTHNDNKSVMISNLIYI